MTDEKFANELKNATKPVLVDFYAEWCGPCQMIGPILEKVAEEMKDSISFIKANVDEIPQTAGKLNIDRIPAVVMFFKEEPISGFIGLRSENDIKDWIKDTLIIKYAKENGFKLNPDNSVVERILKGLKMNEGKHGKRYCPCRRVTGNEEEDKKIICPCAYHKEEIAKDGKCFCGLLVK